MAVQWGQDDRVQISWKRFSASVCEGDRREFEGLLSRPSDCERGRLIAKPNEVLFRRARQMFHAALKDKVLRLEDGVLSNADKGNKASKAIALGIAKRIGIDTPGKKLKGQTAGNEFEIVTANFARETFSKLGHLRPGEWVIQKIGEKVDDEEKPVKKKQAQKDFKKLIKIAQFEQYIHLIAIAKAASENQELAASLGSDYIIKPDVVIFRQLVTDDEINRDIPIVDNAVALLSSLRKGNDGSPLLHASISCKLTIRSDRSQNSRSEVLNLIRNRRGKLPHIVVVTAEPLPSRLASIALGGGDIDCVYHFALPELREAVKEMGNSDSEEALNIMINGRRLKDISDLPLDLAV